MSNKFVEVVTEIVKEWENQNLLAMINRTKDACMFPPYQESYPYSKMQHLVWELAVNVGVREMFTPFQPRYIGDILDDIKTKLKREIRIGLVETVAINRIDRADVKQFRTMYHGDGGALNEYQRIATKSAIYPGKGTPFGLMYAALGLAEAGEVQNKVKKAFRDDGVISFVTDSRAGKDEHIVECAPITPERRAQIVKELGGVLWYVAAVCDEIGATLSEVALQNLEELCSRTERGTLQGDGDNR